MKTKPCWIAKLQWNVTIDGERKLGKKMEHYLMHISLKWSFHTSESYNKLYAKELWQEIFECISRVAQVLKIAPNPTQYQGGSMFIITVPKKIKYVGFFLNHYFRKN
jgi:predicted methyltransferase